MKSEINILKERLVEIAHLVSTLALLEWDQQIGMPEKASDSRAKSIAHLSSLAHRHYVNLDHDLLLTKLKEAVDSKKISSSKDKALILETWKNYEREKKIPESLVKEMAELTSRAHSVWAEARKQNKFSLFEPYLAKIVSLKQKQAKAIGYKNSPYDALIDIYEPGMTAHEASLILGDLKEFLIPFIQQVKLSKKKIQSSTGFDGKSKFDLETQRLFNEMLAEHIGFDTKAGKIAVSTHPFTSGFHPHDVRFTTRYKDNDLFHAIGSTIHETGHALYEQGLPAEHFGTPLGESVSLGIHESQSRMWENNIGKSVEFWKYFYPKLQKTFLVPFKQVKLDQFLKKLNEVKPTLIRTESDEVTYNIHIIIRFEIERGLIEGKIKVKDLPKIWNEKYKTYLGITVPSDSFGCLQDVHWSSGLFGYFPTYSFGNLYAAQFYNAMHKEIPKMRLLISQGKFTEINIWLRKNIHSHGKLFSAKDLSKKISGETLGSAAFKAYLTEKYL